MKSILWAVSSHITPITILVLLWLAWSFLNSLWHTLSSLSIIPCACLFLCPEYSSPFAWVAATFLSLLQEVFPDLTPHTR